MPALVLCLSASACAPEGGRPYRGNDGRTGEYDAVSVGELEQIVWKYRSSAALAAPVSLGGDLVLVVSTDGTVAALEPADGTVRWETRLDHPAYGTPIVAGNRLLIGTDGGLEAIGLDGQVQWTHEGAAVEAAPLVVDAVAYVGDRDGRFLALDVVGGSMIWAATTAGPIVANAVRSGDAIVMGSADGGVYSLDAVTGEPQWAWSAGAAIRGLAATPSRVFVTAGRELVALSPSEPKAAVWRIDLGGVAETPPSLSGGVVVAGTGSGQLVGLDSTDGSPLFKTDLQAPIWGDITVATGRLVVPTTRRGIVVVDRAGKEIWRFRTDGRTVGVTPTAKRLYVTDSAGSVYAIE